MAVFLALVLTIVLAVSASAQQAAPPGALNDIATSADVQALIAGIKSERKEEAVILRPLLRLAPYVVNLEYRKAPARAVIHETDSELLYVIDGAGTLTMGGTLVEPQRQNPQNMAGKAIEGGTPHVLGKGDFVLVPSGTTHSFTAIDGELIVISLRLPRSVQP